MAVPRKPRLHVPGGLYHIVLRGNGRQAIFFDLDDRSRWEDLLAEGLGRYGCRVHAYCWMTNHIHMAVQAGAEPVSRLMGFVASQYARSTNRKMCRSGHLFERRHRQILVQADRYLHALIRYVHLNPVRAGLVENLVDYFWSSHCAYLGKYAPEWLTTDWVLATFGERVVDARRAYCQYMAGQQETGVSKSLVAGSGPDNRVIGDDGFISSTLAATEPLRPRRTLDEIIEDVCLRYDVTEEALASRSRNRRNSGLRAEIALEALLTGTASLASIARRFGRSESVVCRSVTRLRMTRRQ